MKKFYTFKFILFILTITFTLFFRIITQPVKQTTVIAADKPLVVIIPGYGSNLTPDSYSYLINNLTQHGYAVIKYYPKFENISNYNNLVNQWSLGVGSLIGNHKVIVIGHSVGGAVAFHFCAIDKRCIGVINMDGGLEQYEKISVPTLYLQGGVGVYCDKECISGRTLTEKITKDAKGKEVSLPDLRHFNFTDYAENEVLHPVLVTQGYFGSIIAQQGYNEITKQIDIFVGKIN